MVLCLNPNVHHLNPATPNYEEFLDDAKRLCHVTIDHQSIIQSPCDQFLEATKDKIVEDTGAHDLFQFLGGVSSPSNVRN